MFFFFNDTATTEIYTLSLHDALPISGPRARWAGFRRTVERWETPRRRGRARRDRKSTRLNSSHVRISYAVFCLKKKTQQYCRVIHSHASRGRDRLQAAVRLLRDPLLY